MRWFVTQFVDNPFLQRSLMAGVLVAISCSIAGTFVVLRGLAFLGDALAHVRYLQRDRRNSVGRCYFVSGLFFRP